METAFDHFFEEHYAHWKLIVANACMIMFFLLAGLGISYLTKPTYVKNNAVSSVEVPTSSTASSSRRWCAKIIPVKSYKVSQDMSISCKKTLKITFTDLWPLQNKTLKTVTPPKSVENILCKIYYSPYENKNSGSSS